MEKNEEVLALKSILGILGSFSRDDQDFSKVNKAVSFFSNILDAFFFSNAGHLITKTLNGQISSEEFKEGCKLIEDNPFKESEIALFTRYVQMIKSHPAESYEMIKQVLADQDQAQLVRTYLEEMSRRHDAHVYSYNSDEAIKCLEAAPIYESSCTYFPVLGEECVSGMKDVQEIWANSAIWRVCSPSINSGNAEGATQMPRDNLAFLSGDNNQYFYEAALTGLGSDS